MRLPSRKLSFVLGIALALGFVAAAYVALLGRARFAGPQGALPPAQVQALTELGEQALLSKDIPVAALLVYKGEVIGRGFNTVKRSGDAGGHAEINAMGQALAKMGAEGFAALDRNELELITTFEPCPMCQGALAMWNVQKVRFLRAKTISRQWQLELHRLRHLWTRTQASPVDLQEQLFLRHPDYPGHSSTSSTSTTGPSR